jgi:O-antigen/teichoic acid export membrane protein
MERLSGIKRNSVFVLGSNAVRLVATAVAFIGIARLYGPEAFGQFTAAHTLATIFLLLADFGFDVLLSASLTSRPERARELARTYFSMKLVFSLGAALLMLLVAGFQSVSDQTRSLMGIFSAYVLFSALCNFFFALFRSMERMHLETRVAFFMNAALLAAVFILGFAGASLTAVAAAFVLSRILGIVLSLPPADRVMQFRTFRFSWASRAELRTIAVFGAQALLGMLFFTQDTILLSWWAGDREVGVYQSVFKLVTLSLLLSDIMFYSVLPVLSRLRAEEPPQWAELGRLIHKTLVFTGVTVGFVMVAAADELIALVYGAEFSAAAPPLRIFGGTVFLRYSAEASGLMLTSSGRQHIRAWIAFGAVVVNLACNAWAIPRYGATGAAAVSLLTALLVGVSTMVAARTDVLRWFLSAQTGLPVAVAALLSVGIWRLPEIPGIISVPLALAALLLVVVFAGFSRAERKRVFSIKRTLFSPQQTA